MIAVVRDVTIVLSGDLTLCAADVSALYLQPKSPSGHNATLDQVHTRALAYFSNLRSMTPETI